MFLTFFGLCNWRFLTFWSIELCPLEVVWLDETMEDTYYRHVWDMFGTSLGLVWDTFGTRLGHVWDTFGTRLGHLWDIFGTSLGHVRDMFCTSLRHVRDIFWTWHVWDIFRKCWVHLFGHLMDMFGTYLGNFRAICVCIYDKGSWWWVKSKLWIKHQKYLTHTRPTDVEMYYIWTLSNYPS